MLDMKYICHPADYACWSVSWCYRADPLIWNHPRAVLFKKYWVLWLYDCPAFLEIEQNCISNGCNMFIFSWVLCGRSVLCKYITILQQISIFPCNISLLLYFMLRNKNKLISHSPKLVRWCRNIYRSNTDSGLCLLRIGWYMINCWTKIALS